MKHDFRTDDRVKVYATLNGTVAESKATVRYVYHSEDKLALRLDDGREITAHPKQCRKLVKRIKQINPTDLSEEEKKSLIKMMTEAFDEPKPKLRLWRSKFHGTLRALYGDEPLDPSLLEPINPSDIEDHS